MSNATHIGRLKSLESYFSGYMDDSTTFDKKAIQSLVKLSKGVQEIRKMKNGVYDYNDLLVDEEDLTDLREIKPKIEIPSGDFYYKLNNGKTFKVTKGGFIHHPYTSHSVEGIFDENYSIRAVENRLNDKTWTICPEPKSQPQDLSALKKELIDFIEEKFK